MKYYMSFIYRLTFYVIYLKKMFTSNTNNLTLVNFGYDRPTGNYSTGSDASDG